MYHAVVFVIAQEDLMMGEADEAAEQQAPADVRSCLNRCIALHKTGKDSLVSASLLVCCVNYPKLH